jgi:ferredoxin
VWALVLASIAGLFALPFMRPRVALAVARVDPAHCNGCRRCEDDCPYGAIAMVPHPNGRRGAQLARVDADLCASCGICVGACPSSTPFRSTERLETGIDMPQWPIDALRRRLERQLAAARGAPCFVVFGCDHGARIDALASRDTLTFSLACAGMLPPSFVEYALRGGADGVVIATCREGGCEFRLGERWTAQRLGGRREPHLRRAVPAEHWTLVGADAGEERTVRAALERLRHTAVEAAPSQRQEAIA